MLFFSSSAAQVSRANSLWMPQSWRGSETYSRRSSHATYQGSYYSSSCKSIPMLLHHLSYSLICLQGEAGTGNVVEAVRHARTVMKEIRQLKVVITIATSLLYIMHHYYPLTLKLLRNMVITSFSCYIFVSMTFL